MQACRGGPSWERALRDHVTSDTAGHYIAAVLTFVEAHAVAMRSFVEHLTLAGAFAGDNT